MTPSLLHELSIELGVGTHDLLRVIASAPRRYKVYQIPKRSGGTRTIAQPSREVKIIQRYLLDNMLSKLPIHPAAMGYINNVGIADNALVHVKSDYILKMDFKDFFPSIKVGDWERSIKRAKFAISRQDIVLCNYIMFWGNGSGAPQCLSIGAPTSPALSNIVMFGIDQRLNAEAGRLKLNYTRYADDITVSGHIVSAIVKFERFARELIAKTKSPLLIFNEEKRGLYGKGQRRMVTGLIITPEKQLSIGRERKRLISSMIHKVTIGPVGAELLGTVKGLLGFCLATEPTFVSRMREKYGDNTIDYILRSETPKRGRATP